MLLFRGLTHLRHIQMEYTLYLWRKYENTQKKIICTKCKLQQQYNQLQAGNLISGEPKQKRLFH